MFCGGVLLCSRAGLKLSIMVFTLLNSSRTLLSSASSGYIIERLSSTQLITSVIVIPIYLYVLYIVFPAISLPPPGRLPTGWTMSVMVNRSMLWECCVGVFQDRGRRRDGAQPERETEGGVDQSRARGQGMQYPVVPEDPMRD